jgi:protein-disulfide isomerase
VTSRKQEREARRQERVAAEQAAAAQGRRRRLLGMVAAAVLAVSAAVAILIALNSGNPESKDRQQVAQGELAFLNSLPQSGITVGDRSLDVTITEYEDLQCPICAEYSRTELDPLLRQVVQPGKAKLVIRQWQIIGPDSKQATRGALAAAKQNRYLQFVQAFYANQGPENSGYVTDDFMTKVAQQGGLDVARWKRDLATTDPTAHLAESARRASQLGLTGTPAFTITGPDGREQPTDARSAADLEQAVTAAAR